jgi:hypothetical protein
MIARLVDRRFGVHQQRDQVLDLRLGEDPVVSEARHQRARVVSLGVPQLAVGVLAHVVGVAAQLAELVERRPDGAKRHFLGRQLVAGVAVAADRAGRVVGVLLAAAFLRDLLAVLPVAQVLAVRRPRDRREVRLFDLLGDLLRQRLARVLSAELLRLVLVEAVESRLSARGERRLQHRRRLGPGLRVGGRGVGGTTQDERSARPCNDPCNDDLVHGIPFSA